MNSSVANWNRITRRASTWAWRAGSWNAGYSPASVQGAGRITTAVTASPRNVPTMRWTPRRTLLGRSAPARGTAAAAMAQCGWPLPLMTPTVPAAPTARTYRAAWTDNSRRPAAERRGTLRVAPGSQDRRRTQPLNPTRMENTDDPAAISRAAYQGTAVGTEAQAPRARIPKKGPLGFS